MLLFEMLFFFCNRFFSLTSLTQDSLIDSISFSLTLQIKSFDIVQLKLKIPTVVAVAVVVNVVSQLIFQHMAIPSFFKVHSPHLLHLSSIIYFSYLPPSLSLSRFNFSLIFQQHFRFSYDSKNLRHASLYSSIASNPFQII